MKSLREILNQRYILQDKKPLIHAITNPIAINFVANMILSQGALAICAEHPGEVSDIVRNSNSLNLNLGNITDARLSSIDIATKVANENNIPIVLDLVGVGISNLRYEFTKDLISKYNFNIIKGNSSEIKKLIGLTSHAIGIDVGKPDEINEYNIEEIIKKSSEFSKKYKCTLLITGKDDLIIKDENYFIISNGTPTLSKITGTGCALGALISTYLSITDDLSSTILSLLILEISAEIVDKKELASFYTDLMDKISTISDNEIIKYSKIKEGML